MAKNTNAWRVCIAGISFCAYACSSGSEKPVVATPTSATTSVASGNTTTVSVERGLRYFAAAPDTTLRELTTGAPIGWRNLGAECLGDDCKFSAVFTSKTGKFEHEEAWLGRRVTGGTDGRPVWELLDRYAAPGSPWALHSTWECFDASDRRVVAVANSNGTLRNVLAVDRKKGRFVQRPPDGFRCEEIQGD